MMQAHNSDNGKERVGTHTERESHVSWRMKIPSRIVQKRKTIGTGRTSRILVLLRRCKKRTQKRDLSSLHRRQRVEKSRFLHISLSSFNILGEQTFEKDFSTPLDTMVDQEGEVLERAALWSRRIDFGHKSIVDCVVRIDNLDSNQRKSMNTRNSDQKSIRITLVKVLFFFFR